MSSAQADAMAVAVVDVGFGNFHSLEGVLHRLAPSAAIELTDDPKAVERSNCVILPGDGAFGKCIEAIDERDGLREQLVAAACSKPFFGICVGMQMLYESSEESPFKKGLGVLPGKVRRFEASSTHKVPLMGWLDVQTMQPGHELLAGLPPESRYYFLNSFFAPDDGEHVVLRATHASSFAAAVAQGSLVATQFHPEKSSAAGVRLLANFLVCANVAAERSAQG